MRLAALMMTRAPSIDGVWLMSNNEAGPSDGDLRMVGVCKSRMPWSYAELQVLREHYAHAQRPDLLRALPGRSWDAIQRAALTLRSEAGTDAERRALTRRTKLKALWLPEEDAVIRAHYGAASVEQLLQRLPGRTWSMVLRRASRLRMRRDQDGVVARVRAPLDERRRLSEAARHEAACIEAKARERDQMRQCPSVWHLAARVAQSVSQGARA